MVKLYRLMMYNFCVSSSVIPSTMMHEAIRMTFLCAPKEKSIRNITASRDEYGSGSSSLKNVDPDPA